MQCDKHQKHDKEQEKSTQPTKSTQYSSTLHTIQQQQTNTQPIQETTASHHHHHHHHHYPKTSKQNTNLDPLHRTHHNPTTPQQTTHPPYQTTTSIEKKCTTNSFNSQPNNGYYTISTFLETLPMSQRRWIGPTDTPSDHRRAYKRIFHYVVHFHSHRLQEYEKLQIKCAYANNPDPAQLEATVHTWTRC